MIFLFIQKSEPEVEKTLPIIPPMDEYFNDGFHCDINVRYIFTC